MTASLRVKNDKYYVVLTHTTDGKKNQTWVSTGLSVTGNEGKARQIMLDMLGEKPEQAAPSDMLFSDAVRRWLEGGSTSQRLVQSSPVPVLLVTPPASDET